MNMYYYSVYIESIFHHFIHSVSFLIINVLLKYHILIFMILMLYELYLLYFPVISSYLYNIYYHNTDNITRLDTWIHALSVNAFQY